MSEIQKHQEAADKIIQPQTQFNGYSLDELRYQRALVLLQKEFCKSRINRNLNNLRKSNPLAPSSSSSLTGKVGFVASKLISGLSYLDYAMIGFSLFGTARKVFSVFRKIKKK